MRILPGRPRPARAGPRTHVPPGRRMPLDRPITAPPNALFPPRRTSELAYGGGRQAGSSCGFLSFLSAKRGTKIKFITTEAGMCMKTKKTRANCPLKSGHSLPIRPHLSDILFRLYARSPQQKPDLTPFAAPLLAIAPPRIGAVLPGLSPDVGHDPGGAAANHGRRDHAPVTEYPGKV